MEIGHIDHPGTTVQCFAAVVIFIKHLFSSSHVPTYQDVIINSESYLYVCSVLLLIMFIAGNYLLGLYVFRHTGSMGTAMVFQLTPLIHINIVRSAVVLAPEAFIVIAASFFMAYLYIKCIINKVLDLRTVIFFGLFSGFLIATKYVCAPVIILVLFLLEKNRQRLVYIVASVFSFFLFIIPAIPKLKNMYLWVWALFSHDGIYGAGEQRVVNPSVFLKNLKDIFLTDTIFTSMYAIITLACVVAVINRKKTTQINLFLRAIAGVWLCISLLILAVAKHCEFHYLIFAECCFPLGLMLSYRIFSISWSPFIQRFQRHQKQLTWSVFAAAGIFLIIEKIRYVPSQYYQPVGISKYVDEYKTVPLVISVNGLLACERKEPALFLGYMYSGNLLNTYYPFLEKMYPDTYLYTDGSQNVIHWEQSIPITRFYEKNKKILVYLKGYDNARQQALLHQFCPAVLSGNEQVVFRDTKTLQGIYLLNNCE